MSSVINAMKQNGLDEETLRRLLKIVSFKKGEMILQAHQVSEYLHIIYDGLVKVYTINAGGEEAVAVIYGKKDIFPLSWIIQSHKKSVYYQAITDCRIALLPQKILLEQMKSSASVAFAMAERILKQYELYASRVNNLEFTYGRERLAYRLLLLCARFGKRVDQTIVIPRINQHDLAAMINMSRESLSREMSRYERRGVVRYTNDSIIILNERELRAELGEDTPVVFYDS